MVFGDEPDVNSLLREITWTFPFTMKRVLPVVITYAELLKVLEGTPDPQKRLAWLLGFFACMRVSEVVNLKRENVDIETRTIHILQGKGCKDRNIPLPKECVRAIRYLPVSVGCRALQISFKAHAKRVLGKDLRFHCLRHSGATYLLNVLKWDIRLIQTLLGHSRIATTEIYTHVSTQNLIDRMWMDT